MKQTPTCIILLSLACMALLSLSAFAVRIKDICSIEGVRDNQLVGYGLVVGLNGTGDDTDTQFTKQSLVSYLKRNNIQVDPAQVKVKNVAAVIVTATLPPFAKQGSKMDVTVSAIGSAADLHGGVLLATPLRPSAPSYAGLGQIFAMAQGSISTGGFAAGQKANSVVKNHPVVATVPNGATVEREVPTAFETKPEINLLLRNPDFTTAERVSQIINNSLGGTLAAAHNSSTVSVKMPAGGGEERVKFISQMEALEVSPDSPARVVYNERTGTIVMGANVRISTAVISHGNLIFRQEDTSSETLQPGGFGMPPVKATNSSSSLTVEEGRGKAQVMQEGVTIGEVAQALNALGVTARDVISILQALKECGALQAELVSM